MHVGLTLTSDNNYTYRKKMGKVTRLKKTWREIGNLVTNVGHEFLGHILWYPLYELCNRVGCPGIVSQPVKFLGNPFSSC